MKNSNASFVQRLGALLVDLCLIFLVTSLFTSFLVNNDNYEKLSKESNQVMEDYVNSKIDPKTYVSRVGDISYDLSRETALVSILTIAVYILYFIVFQFYQKGQTLGKKLFKIRVVNNDSGDLSMNQLAIRSLLINNILVDIVVLAFSILGTRNTYFVSTSIVQIIQYILLFVTVLMVLSRKDKRGLHDLFANTKVIKEV